MRIIILTNDHIYSNYILKELIKFLKRDIVLIVESSVLLHNQSLIKALLKYLKVSGFYYVIIQAIKLSLYKFISKLIHPIVDANHKFYPYQLLAKQNKIKVSKSDNVNLQRNFLKKYKPDLIISVFFNQILSQDIIKIPKIGVINIHPAYLPNYKGVSPIFWALTNREKYIGVTIHWINVGIDTGGIIIRKKIIVLPKDTEDSLYFKCAKESANLLLSFLNKPSLQSKKRVSNAKGSYFSIPTKDAVRKFIRKRSFFNLREYLFTH